ncbi:hypothetical protein D3C72_2304810 [compost metagenome]
MSAIESSGAPGEGVLVMLDKYLGALMRAANAACIQGNGRPRAQGGNYLCFEEARVIAGLQVWRRVAQDVEEEAMALDRNKDRASCGLISLR